MLLLPVGAGAAVMIAAAALPAAAAAVAARSAPASVASCETGRGTIVAVDFGHWGGPVLHGCDIGADTGYALLHDAGFSTAGTARDGPAFVCRLGSPAFRGGTQFPTPRQDPCVVTPPASASWSLWTAGRGSNAWHYDRVGAMSDVPVAGGVEFWQFAPDTDRPTSTPDQLRARPAARAGKPVAPAPVPTPDGSSGSPTALIAAGALVVVIGGGAGWTMWRRRRSRS